MTNTTYNTTITASLPDWTSGTIDFMLLSSIAISGAGEISPGETLTMTLNGSGAGTLDLPTIDNTGDNAWLWQVKLPDKREANVSIAYSAASQDLSTILAAVQSSTTPSSVALLIANKQDKDADAVSGNLAIFNSGGETIDSDIPASWNATDQTMDITMSDDVTLQVGQEFVLVARNNSGAQITNGQLVKLTGSVSDRPTIALAQADSVANSRFIGMATETIDNNSTGIVTIAGNVRGLNTNAYNEGDVLYLSTATPGAYTDTKPTYPDIAIEIGQVVRKNASDGIIFVGAYETGSGAYDKASAAQTAAQTYADNNFYNQSAFSASPTAAEPLKADGSGGIEFSGNVGVGVTADTPIHAQTSAGQDTDILKFRDTVVDVSAFIGVGNRSLPVAVSPAKSVYVRTGSASAGIVFSPSTSYEGLLVLNGVTGRVGINKTNAALGAQLHIVPNSSSEKGQIIQLAAAQTANALEVQDSAGTVLSGVDSDGKILIPDGGKPSPGLQFQKDVDTGIFRPTTHALGISVQSVEAVRVDADSTAGNTRFLIYDVDNATLERVSVGAADSGGAGYKVLRIPN